MPLTNKTFTLLALPLCAALTACAADPQDDADLVESDELPSESSQALQSVPESLAVPAGNHLGFWLPAKGVQIYKCALAASGSYTWTFVEPEADLFGPFGKIVVGHHYVGPTWEAFDGSTVVASKVAGETVDATAIPWLLLKAVSNTGPGLMAKVTYIQRLYTVGGLAPSTGCDADHAGAEADVPYTATYTFYR
ncbi:MAG: DUF3455 domain-containing protein [Myxococcales bacterium]